MNEDDDAGLDVDSGDDSGGADDSEGFLQAIKDAWTETLNFLPTSLALSDPFSAFTMGDGNEPVDGPTVQGGALLTGTLSDIKGDALTAVGIDPNTPIWVYLVALIVILLLVAYITREVAG